MRSRWLSACVAVVLCLAGGYALLAALSGAADLTDIPDVLRAPGGLLFGAFSWAGFYVPVYLFACAVLVALPSFRRDVLAVLTFSIVPFLTASLLLKVFAGDAQPQLASILVSSFGSRGGAMMLLLLFCLELVVAFRLWTEMQGSHREEAVPFPGGERSEAASPEAEVALPRSLSLPGERRERVVASLGERRIETSSPEASDNAEPSGAPAFEERDLPALRRRLDPPVEAGVETAASSPAHEAASDEPTPGETVPAAAEDPFGESVIVYRNGAFSDRPRGGDFSPEAESPNDDEANEDGETDDLALEEDERRAEAPAPGRSGSYFVPLDPLLNDYPDGEYWNIDSETEKASQVLMRTLEEFNIQAEVTGIRKGPVITMFEILPAPGVKLSKIVNLADNIALRLAASRVRIVAPIPGKHAVGIEVPNKQRAIVSFKEMIASESIAKTKMEIPVVLGKDITGGAQIVDLVQTPHLLIAGATGSGKSVCVNSIICSILYCRRPEEVKMILIDPKIVELKLYNDIPHLLTPVITEPKRAFQALQYCIYEMERRYSLLDSMGVRDIRSYNRRVRERRIATLALPYILIIVDEFADLMATTGKELESTLARLAAMSRAVGIHLVLATQRPSIDVITGLIKANIPSRIAFMVASKFDSRIIIDGVGAEMLLGRGDMLFASAWDPYPVRIQGAYLSEEEVERVTAHVRTLGEPDYIDEEIFIDDEGDDFKLMNDDGSDPMLEAALDIVVGEGKTSASYLQRRLKIGYNRAARIVEELEERGIVGPQQGSKPRELLHVPDRYKE